MVLAEKIKIDHVDPDLKSSGSTKSIHQFTSLDVWVRRTDNDCTPIDAATDRTIRPTAYTGSTSGGSEEIAGGSHVEEMGD
jgi:hypothetical protein